LVSLFSFHIQIKRDVSFTHYVLSPLFRPDRALRLLCCQPLVVGPAGLKELGLEAVGHGVRIG
jgi:hypothetical protein